MGELVKAIEDDLNLGETIIIIKDSEGNKTSFILRGDHETIISDVESMLKGKFYTIVKES